jgi:transposase, IS5 family
MWGADIEAVVLRPDEAKRSKAGRKPFDAILMFRMLILQLLYNLSDEQIEYQVRDRMRSRGFSALNSRTTYAARTGSRSRRASARRS